MNDLNWQPVEDQLTQRELEILRLMAAGDRATYERLRLRPDLLAEVEGVLETQLEHHLDRRLKSLQFLRHMRVSA